MSTIIRVKRSLTEDPSEEKIVLNVNKRQKTEHQPETCAIFKFASTIENLDQTEANFKEHIQKLKKNETIRKFALALPVKGNLEKRLEENKQKRLQNRFKIVNLSRSQRNNNEDITDLDLIILDVEKDEKEATTSKEEGFVYDLYIADDEKTPENYDINDLSIMDYEDYLYSCPRLVENDPEEVFDNEDSDSNDENYWQNDYPDEDDEFCYGGGGGNDDDDDDEREMRRAMKNFDLDNELSSDEDYVEFDDENDSNVNLYGKAYARYKNRVLNEFKHELDDSEDEDSD